MDKAQLTVLLVIGAITLFILIWKIASSVEKRDWNKGYCKCGGRWKLFDVDSQGGRGYVCQSCRNRIWISYKVDKEYIE